MSKETVSIIQSSGTVVTKHENMRILYGVVKFLISHRLPPTTTTNHFSTARVEFIIHHSTIINQLGLFSIHHDF